jgi:superfamily II DNA or RNA helicase
MTDENLANDNIINNIRITGTFNNKSKIYTDGIIKKQLEEYLGITDDAIEKFFKYFSNINEIAMTPTKDSYIVKREEKRVCVKSNSDMDPTVVISLLINDIENFEEHDIQPDNEQEDVQEDEQEDLTKKLLSYQIPHLYQLYETFKVNNCILDASDTGTGKTYVAIVLAHMLKLKPFIICPKSVISSWINIAKDLNVELLGVSNYESIKTAKYYTTSVKKINCPYVKIVNKNDDDDNRDYDYIFDFPKDTIVIFDEAHRCKNHKSSTSKILLSIITNKIKILLLSATITDKILCFKPFGVAFGFYEKVQNFRVWIKRKITANKKKYAGDLNDNLMLRVINDNVFPQFGSRMKICELGDLFPQNQVIAKLYYCSNYQEIQKEYDNIKVLFEEYKQKEKDIKFPLAQILYARMRIEQFKIPIFIDLANEALDNGYSIAIFTCFKDTMLNLAEQLQTDCLIHGDQSLEERNSCIQDFQSNKCKIIISMIQAGSVGISLHDIHGGHPRMSLISPSWNGIEMKQALGRIFRAGAKTPALQRLIYCAKTYEEEICKLIEKKLDVIEKINNGMLVDNEIDIEIVKEINNDDKKFEIIADTKDIDKKDKKIAKEQIMGEKKPTKQYYTSAIGDAENAMDTLKKLQKNDI